MTFNANIQEKFTHHKMCVVIPTYNNSATLSKVIKDVLCYTKDVIVVNDGSTDDTAGILEKIDNITVISYENNKGKGWALRKGFKSAISLGFDYAITIDSDGQHFASDIPVFIEKLEKEGPSLIIGSRNMEQNGIPAKSSFGNKFSNFWFWIETGIKSSDTQSGFRLYPLSLFKDMNFFTTKYEFEIEVIVRNSWKGVKILNTPISVFYAPGKERISHFRPFQDFSRISVLNTFLVPIALLFIHPRNLILKLFKKETHENIWKQLVNPEESTMKKTLSVSFGVFMGIIPIWGFQMATALFLAFIFKLNKFLVLVSANISLPPLIPFIIFLSYKLGGIWMENEGDLVFDNNLTLDDIQQNFMQYLYGSITFAIISAVIAGLTTFTALSLSKNKVILSKQNE